PGADNPSTHCATLRRASAGDIAGRWAYSGGVVRIAGALPRIVGVVAQRTKLSVCTHAVGEAMWVLTGGGGDVYTGTNLGFAPGSCTRREKHQAVFAATGNTLYLRIARRPDT